MLGHYLLTLAETVELSQSEIARELGVSPKLANFWALGLREVAARHREPLVRCISKAMRNRLHLLGRYTPAGRVFAREVLALVTLSREENLRARGIRPDVTIEQCMHTLAAGLQGKGLQPDTRAWRESVELLTRSMYVIALVDWQLAEFCWLHEDASQETDTLMKAYVNDCQLTPTACRWHRQPAAGAAEEDDPQPQAS